MTAFEDRYISTPGETPIFARLLHEYRMGYEQNTRFWERWWTLMSSEENNAQAHHYLGMRPTNDTADNTFQGGVGFADLRD